MSKTDIFHFNHIDKSIDDDNLLEIKALYKFYHKRFCCYKKAFKYFERIHLIINITSTGLIAMGAIVGSVTLNPIVLGTISGSGLLLETFSEIENYKNKIEMSKFAYKTYEKVLVDLCTSLSSNKYNHSTFINNAKIIDEIIIDMCPPLDSKFEKAYNKKITSE